MEANSEAEDRERMGKNANSSSEGQQARPKRQMKTPFQLETLEKAYAMDTYPSEAVRVELSEKLGLTDRQLQMWFCHRRLKDKKENQAKKPRKTAVMEAPVEDFRTEAGSDYGSGSGSGSSPLAELRKPVLDDVPLGRRHYESSPQSVMELRAIACVEDQLGEPIREDGPILGIEFDSLPPDAFGAPLAEQQKRLGHSYESKIYEQRDVKLGKGSRLLHDYRPLQDPSSIRSDTYGQVAQSHFHDPSIDALRARSSLLVHGDEVISRVHGFRGHASRLRMLPQQESNGQAFPSPYSDDDRLPQHESSTSNRMNTHLSGHLVAGPENMDFLPDGQIFHGEGDLKRKRKNDEARIAREVDVHEIRIRKELEKQENLRRKNEERMRKEMERHDRERRKEEERLMREKQKEEERSQREQRREMERREKFLQREHLRAEKMRQKEELRKEKEAVRLKAALEKATARRIAKESMDLIEDEQLELMELAAKSKGLPSMIHLDHDTLQNLESFRDSLSVFPLKSLQLKKPLSTQPWVDSEENVGNLLMVWRYLITFADVLGLWPFTLDELVQSFHDFDSRLLSEIHVALLKVIIKDIEDVARTPSTGLGTNQYCSAHPEGGHPQIVEGAYAWGFNIRSWQQHLNPLTWPEIFRQLALSAGFGPQLKKRSSAWGYSCDKEEGKGREDVISTLRSGSAAENAFASMREKGLLLPRRSRHRLTPGTVKFAAFHVLSLEGSKGLTVLELAEKIQKSGLRDLTTSKTPEASISVALTRDTKLFERIAPSTYCVRALYRKDPADAEAILTSARKKIRIFENGFLGGEDVDVEKDEDSECDVDDDAEVDGLATPLVASKDADHCIEEQTSSKRGKDKDCGDVEQNKNESENLLSILPMNGSDGTNKPSSDEQCIAGKDVEARYLGPESIEIDESDTGESWVQGLTEGEYSHLSVEERLHALVALIGVANEGSSIRFVLEDRLEAANALKKQMWAEAQVDKSCMREDIMRFPLFSGSKAEMKLNCSPSEGRQSSLPVVDNQSNYVSPGTVEDPKLLLGSQSIENHPNGLPTERASIVQDLSINPDNFSVQHHGFASKRSRSELKSYISHLAEEMYVYRSLPLGQDRRRNRYWQFVASASRNDPCSGRIFVELQGGKWRLIDSEEAFDTLLSSLDTRGIRESHLSVMLQRIEAFFGENVRRNVWCCNNVNKSETTITKETSEMDSSSDCPAGVDSPSSMVCGLNSDISDASFRVSIRTTEFEKEATLERYQDFQKWMWQECFCSLKLCASKYGKKMNMQLLDSCNVCLHCYLPEENHCPNCHQTIGNADSGFSFSEHTVHCEGKRSLIFSDGNISCSSPLGIRLIKALSAFVEASLPLEALASYWTEDYRRSWGATLNVSSSPEELLQILTQLERAIDRESLSTSFETTKELLGSYVSSHNVVFDSAGGLVSVLPWIPRTTAALALRLFELDAAIIYTQDEKIEPCEDKEDKLYVKLPSMYSPQKTKEVEPKVEQDKYTKEENLADSRSSRSIYRRGRGGRGLGCGTRWQRRGPGLESGSGRQNARESENLNQKLRHQGRRTNGKGYGRGRRTIRRRAERVTAEVLDDDVADETINIETNGQPRRNVVEEEWDGEIIGTHMGGVGNINCAEAADSDDNAEAVGYDQVNWEQGFDDVSNKWNENLMDESDEDIMNVSGDDNGFEDEGDEELVGNIDVGESSDEKTNKVVFDDGSESESIDDDYSD
ncbi:homeobox-DDT domain protein RLT1-like isoform X2 [Tripterygium wilfordii]|uniref:homeobox-DDT domain protein RLT1-like isoform X2 n=1 Tax=Tripterygium wilfordii TaxID=458696 RepID=UPI0018F7EDE8|nr:homeobox-DDT domain protein RLT1-like isoform X2 [Tripterygium wilfordii]